MHLPFLLLPTLALLTPARTQPVEASPGGPDVELAIVHACQRLVELQENMSDPEGMPCEWPYEGVYREGGQIPPGYRVGGTAIAAWALIEAPGYTDDVPRKEAVERGLAFVLDQLEDEPRMAAGFRGTYDVRGWGHTYALEFLLRLRERGFVPAGESARVEAMIPDLVDRLEGIAISSTGGWNYARRGGADDAEAGASAFMTAPTLLALLRARAAGEEVQDAVLNKGFAALRRGLRAEGVTAYNSKGGARDTVPGSIGRLPVSYLALGLEEAAVEGDDGGEVGGPDLEGSVKNFLAHWAELEKRRRQTGTHVAPHGIAPYYFFYAHLYASFAIEELPESVRAGYRKRFLERLFEVREEGVGWNDRVFDRSENFGTATSLLALLAPGIERLP